MADAISLVGRTALITGSNRGIGSAIARRFAIAGARVVVHGRDADAVERVRAAIESDGGRAIGVTADVTRFEDIEAMRQRIETEWGVVDVLVCNAGGNPSRPAKIEDVTEEDWHAAINANLTSTFLTVKSFLPAMKRLGTGTIVTVSSAAARRPTLGSPTPYGAAKAGIEVFTRHLAVQAGPFGVRANCIAPETILTERNARQIPAETQSALAESHPLRRLGSPDDVADAALFLSSDGSNWITGTVIDIAGGAVLA